MCFFVFIIVHFFFFICEAKKKKRTQRKRKHAVFLRPTGVFYLGGQVRTLNLASRSTTLRLTQGKYSVPNGMSKQC